MNTSDTLFLPVLSTGKVDTPLDFTVSIWIKVEGYSGKTIEDFITILAFQDSVRCYVTSTDRVMCDAASRAVLEVSSPLITSGEWINLQLSCRSDGFATLTLRTDSKFLGEDTMTNFPLTQRVSKRWAACFGACIGRQSFIGGLREVTMIERFVDDEIMKEILAHQVLVYNNDFKCYFRFQKEIERFNKDYFVDRPWLSFSGLKDGAPLESVQGLDFISNDICELSYEP